MVSHRVAPEPGAETVGQSAITRVRPQGLPVTARVRKAAEYRAVLRQGRRVGRSAHFVLMYLAPSAVAASPDQSCLQARLGLIVGKRNAARAVTRNAVKRVWREAFRVRRDDLPAGQYVARLAMRAPDLTLGLLKRQMRAEADTLLRQATRGGKALQGAARAPTKRPGKPSS